MITGGFQQRRWRFRGAVAALCAAMTAGAAGSLQAREAVTILQLPWYHQFQFAGFYAAEKRGYYEEAGLEVEIRAAHGHPDGDYNPVAAVLLGDADFGVARSDLLIHHGRGLPVTVLANLFQRSAFKLMTLERYGIERLEDLDDQPISFMFTDQARASVVDAEAVVALRNAGLQPEALNTRYPQWDLDRLQTGATQLMPGYATDRAYLEKRLGETPVFISPRDYGTDFYGDLLFTSSALVAEEPDYVEAFRDASLRGWRYALDHPEAVIDWLLEHYETRSPDYDRGMLLEEARAMEAYIRDDLVELGHINPERWRRIAGEYRRLGLLGEVNWDEFLYLPDPRPARAWRQALPWMAGVGGFVLLLGGFTFWLWSTNRRLVVQLHQREEATESLRVQAEQDALTGLGNRRQMQRMADAALREARAGGYGLGCIVLDVDHFKALNDEHGHRAGDEVLTEIAARIRERTRSSDLVFRYGGEEFVILTLGSSEAAAVELAERIREAAAGAPFRPGGVDRPLRLTVSLGVAVLDGSDPDFAALLERADRNLYVAKRRGRNRVASRLQK